MHESDVSPEKLAADLRLVISDAEALLRATVGEAGEAATAARAKMRESLESAMQKLGIPQQRIDHLKKQDNPALVAELVKELQTK